VLTLRRSGPLMKAAISRPTQKHNRNTSGTNLMTRKTTTTSPAADMLRQRLLCSGHAGMHAAACSWAVGRT
jgi:hypothetical protein